MTDLMLSVPMFDRVGRADYWIPRGALVVASELRGSGLDVRLIDMDLLADNDGERRQRIAEIIRREKPERIFLSIHGLFAVARFAYLLDFEEIRSENADIAFVAGGPLLTVNQEYVRRFLDVDQTVIGHVDSSTITQLVEGIKTRERTINLTPSADGRYAYHVDEKIYEDLIGLAGEELGTPKISAHLETVRSCPHNCAFCSIPATFPHLPKGRIQLRRLQDIESELDFLASHGIEEINLGDPTFGVDWRHATEVMDRLSGRFSWGVMSRGEGLTEERLRVMHGSGCTSIALGIETPDCVTLEAVHKKTTAGRNAETILRIKNAGIEPIALVILGLSERDDFAQLTKYLYENRVEKVVATIYHPTPGSDSFEKDVGRAEMTSVRDLEDFDFLGLPVLDFQDTKRLEARRLAIRTAYANPNDRRYRPETEELKRILATEPNEFEYAWVEDCLVARIGQHVYLYEPPGEYGEFRPLKLSDEGDGIETARQAMREWKTDESVRKSSYEAFKGQPNAKLAKARSIREEILAECKGADFQRRLRERANREPPGLRRLLLYPHG